MPDEQQYPVGVRAIGGPVRGVVTSWELPLPADMYAIAWRVNGGDVWGVEREAPAVDNADALQVHRYSLDGEPVDDIATYRWQEQQR